MYQLKSTVETALEIKKSRFIGQLYPVFSRTEAQIKLKHIRALHPNAVHVCWVLLCDGDSGLDDDGEPSGTAAKPMYNVLVHKSLFNILAVVVRYWGGIKLGAGGLTRAYGQAISDAFKCAELQNLLMPIEVLSELRLAVDFADESPLRRFCEQRGAHILDVSYAEKAILHLTIKSLELEAFCSDAHNFLRGKMTRIDTQE